LSKFIGFSILCVALATAIARVQCATAHGTPIHVEVVNNSLSVSGGRADAAGFASMVFVEDDEDGDPFGEVTLPGFGPAIIWQIPGYEIFGMSENSGLFLDVLSRPVANSNPAEQRVLWYWNPQSALVEHAPANNPLQIRKSSTQNITLSPSSGVAPASLQIAAPLASDMGFHNHLIAYALSDDPPAPAGAYGFFARLSSTQYGPSDPFLIVLNNGIFDYEQMVPAATAINATAVDSLPGDNDHDGDVDAADYVAWRKKPGTLAEYQIWQSHFAPLGAGSGISTASVPEPQSTALVVSIMCCYSLLLSRRWRRQSRNRLLMC
jgi:hypothetical protein